MGPLWQGVKHLLGLSQSCQDSLRSPVRFDRSCMMSLCHKAPDDKEASLLGFQI